MYLTNKEGNNFLWNWLTISNMHLSRCCCCYIQSNLLKLSGRNIYFSENFNLKVYFTLQIDWLQLNTHRGSQYGLYSIKNKYMFSFKFNSTNSNQNTSGKLRWNKMPCIDWIFYLPGNKQSLIGRQYFKP